MSKPKVVIYESLTDDVLKEIKNECEVTYLPGGRGGSREEVEREIHDAVGLLGSGMVINEELLQKAPQLKVVSNISVGYNNFDVEALTSHQVYGTHTPEVLNDTVADTIFGLLVATARRMPELDQYVKKGQWKKNDEEEAVFGVDVHHKTLGLIGMGRIGKTIAKRAHGGFDMNILYHNRSRDMEAEETYGARYCENRDDLLREADFVCLMVPLTAETEGFFTIKDFEKMKKDAIFINGARGPVVVEEDLIQALETKMIRTAGLDVFHEEPVPADHPLLKMPHVVTLPHIGSATAETRHKMVRLAIKNLLAGIRGETPPNAVNEL